jgi:hypothetical protein
MGVAPPWVSPAIAAIADFAAEAASKCGGICAGMLAGNDEEHVGEGEEERSDDIQRVGSPLSVALGECASVEEAGEDEGRVL